MIDNIFLLKHAIFFIFFVKTLSSNLPFCVKIKEPENIDVSPEFKSITLAIGEATQPLIVTSAISSDHFQEWKGMFESVRRYFGEYVPVVVFDLGLEEIQKKTLESEFFLFVVRFRFEVYPEHYKNLLTYAWKPECVREVTTAIHADVIVWSDASGRAVPGASANYLLNHINQNRFGVAVAPSVGMHIQWQYTHPGMYKYFSAQFSPYEKMVFRPATVAAFVPKHKGAKLFIDRWIACARVQECISPAGSSPFGCPQNVNFTPAMPCHRFDQAILAFLLVDCFYADEDELHEKVSILGPHIGRLHHPVKEPPQPWQFAVWN